MILETIEKFFRVSFVLFLDVVTASARHYALVWVTLGYNGTQKYSDRTVLKSCQHAKLAQFEGYAPSILTVYRRGTRYCDTLFRVVPGFCVTVSRLFSVYVIVLSMQLQLQIGYCSLCPSPQGKIPRFHIVQDFCEILLLCQQWANITSAKTVVPFASVMIPRAEYENNCFFCSILYYTIVYSNHILTRRMFS